jgi:tetratricopeptide (TPR) repeat protein
MLKSPMFTLAVGLMVGLALGYVLAERESVPPVSAMQTAAGSSASSTEGLPPGHPPIDQTASQSPRNDSAELTRQSASLRAMLQKNPKDAKVLAALGNLYYDHSQWPEAKGWYEQTLKVAPEDTDVLTDLAVVERNLGAHEDALQTLDRVLKIDPSHWQALYNKAIILNFDLHRHDDAKAALDKLERMRKDHPEIPDLASLRAEIAGKG